MSGAAAVSYISCNLANDLNTTSLLGEKINSRANGQGQIRHIRPKCSGYREYDGNAVDDQAEQIAIR